MALLFWYAFTGCDTVSSFNGCRKKTAWVVWAAFPEITDAFARLSLSSTIIDEGVLSLLERFVVLLYDRTGSSMSVNDARRSTMLHISNLGHFCKFLTKKCWIC